MTVHGYVELEWDGDILIVRPRGPFNLEGSLSALDEIKSAALSSSLTHWGRLTYLDRDSIGSPEVMAAVRESYQWCLENGCYGIALVSNNQLQTSILTEQTHPAINAFCDEEEARQWLEEQKRSINCSTDQS